MDAMLQQVVELENHGYQFEAAEASFDLLVQRAAGTFKPHFELLNYHVDVETDGDGHDDHRGHGEAPRRRRGAARSGRRRRPGERPGRRPAKSAQRPFPEPRGDAAGRLQGPRHQQRGRHRRRRARRHRKPRRATTSGAPSASAKTSSKPVGSRWSTASNTSCARTSKRLLYPTVALVAPLRSHTESRWSISCPRQ